MRQYSPVRFNEVRVEGAFWRERLDTVLKRTIPSQYHQLQIHHMLESLDVVQPPPPLTIPRNRQNFTTQIFWDSDIGKWIEAASYALFHGRDATIESQIDAITDKLAKAQLADGYLNLWYIGREVDKRWTNLRDNHELYCAGHMLEGAIAYFMATGKRRLLDIMEKYVDLIARVFGPGPEQKHGYPGHQELELALVRLYHLTGERKRLDLAAYFINERGREPRYFEAEAKARGERPEEFWQGTFEYNQSHKPVREQDKVVGHAVRAMYMYTAMADLAADLGDDGLKRACEVLWDDLTTKRMYVTGGLGPAAANEGFTKDYDLPNDTAYCETCASVALIFWAQRMLNLDLNGKYADALEQALYNNALSGLSRDGEHYFYANPLESDGGHQRWTWHVCPCCSDERGAAGRLGRRLLLFDRNRRTRRAPLWRHRHHRRCRRHQGPCGGGERLSLVGCSQDRRRSGNARRVRPQAAHSGLGPRGRGETRRQRRAGRRRGQPRQRLCDDPAHLVEG